LILALGFPEQYREGDIEYLQEAMIKNGQNEAHSLTDENRQQ